MTIGIEDDMCIDIPCRPPDNLDQAPCIAEEPFLVCIEDPDEPDLGDVEPFPQEVDPDKHIELPETEFTDDLAAFERLDLGVEVPGPDPLVCKELREFLGKFLGQRGHEHPVTPFDRRLHFTDHIIGLAFYRPHLDFGVNKPGRTDDLLDQLGGFFEFVIAGSCRYKDHIAHVLLELVELQRTVVVCAREAEPVINQGFFPRTVTVVHAVQLGNRLVALIDNHKKIVREIIKETVGFLTCFPAVKVPGIILDPFAGTGLFDHLEIEPGPLFKPVCLDHPECWQTSSSSLRIDAIAVFRVPSGVTKCRAG